MKQGIYKIFITVCILIGCLSSCVDDDNVPAENVTNAKKPTLSDVGSVVVTASTITITGEVTEHNGYPVTERGICWGTTNNLSIDKDLHKAMTDNANGIELTTDNLQSNTLYYYCLYAKNQAGVTYGTIASKQTLSGLGSVETIIYAEHTRATTAKAGGKITDRGEGDILECGVLYFKASDFANRDSIIGTLAQDSFVCDLSSLSPATTYKVQAYVKNKYGIFRGDSLPLHTGSGKPILSDINKLIPKSNQATVGANVSSTGDATTLIERGFCWSKTENPPTTDHDVVLVVFSGNGTGAMEAVLQPLIPNQEYFVAAFARNEFGTTYSPAVKFKTSDNLPSVTTLGHEFVNDNSVILSGRVTDIGDSNVHTIGICYATHNSPTTSGPKVEIVLSPALSEVPHNFSTGEITGLKGSTTYHYRTYAFNDNGTPAYGNLSSFTTPPIFTQESGSFEGGTRYEGSPAYFVIGAKGYLLGGDRGPSLANNLWRYTPAMNPPNKWEEADAYTAGSMRWPSVAVMDTKVYVLGGSGSGSVDKDDFFMYNAASNQWIPRTIGPPPGHSRAGFALNNSEVVYVGGMQGGIAKDEVWGYNVNTDTWTLKTNFPVSQYGGVAFNINNTIYAGLGKNTAGVGNTQLWKSNGALTAWIPEPSGSILSGNVLAGTVYDNKIYVIDKVSPTKYTIFEYNPATQEWKRKSDLPNNYDWAISFMFTIQNRIYIGFADGDKVVSYNPLWDN